MILVASSICLLVGMLIGFLILSHINSPNTNKSLYIKNEIVYFRIIDYQVNSTKWVVKCGKFLEQNSTYRNFYNILSPSGEIILSHRDYFSSDKEYMMEIAKCENNKLKDELEKQEEFLKEQLKWTFNKKVELK